MHIFMNIVENCLIATGIFIERNDVILDVNRCPRPL